MTKQVEFGELRKDTNVEQRCAKTTTRQRNANFAETYAPHAGSDLAGLLQAVRPGQCLLLVSQEVVGADHRRARPRIAARREDGLALPGRALTRQCSHSIGRLNRRTVTRPPGWLRPPDRQRGERG